MAQGWDVIVMNPNDNARAGKPIPRSSCPNKHAEFVWENFVLPAKNAKVAIAAHSYGGAVTINLAERFADYFLKRVVVVGLTDSVQGSIGSNEIGKHLWKVGILINFILNQFRLFVMFY